jgi:hypothetical protein
MERIRCDGAMVRGAKVRSESAKVRRSRRTLTMYCRTAGLDHRTIALDPRTLAPSPRRTAGFLSPLFRLQPPGDPFDLMADSQLARAHDLRR